LLDRYGRFMPRHPRIQAPDVLYHVGSRAVDKQTIFGIVRRDWRVFCDLLDYVVVDFEWNLHAYCVMRNHFHLVLDTPRANLSDGMQYLKGEYAQWFNHAKGREGALFERRFWYRMAVNDAYVLELARYVALNPVRSGFVRRPEEWPWSSYAATTGRVDRPRSLRVDDLLGWFGGGHQARLLFEEFVEEMLDRSGDMSRRDM
jgi:putative transposase